MSQAMTPAQQQQQAGFPMMLQKYGAEIARALVASGKVPQLPVASPAARQITEALMRRGGATVPQ
jgi:hypothetical protein